MTYDVAIIGAGVVGAFVARELSRYNLKIVLLEKFNDVAMGTSKANSAIVHAGFDALSGTLKAKMNVEGTRLMPEVCKELNVPFRPCGSVVVAFSDAETETVHKLYERGKVNGVPEMEIIGQEKLREIEPHISENAKAALYAKTAGIVCPYELTLAAAENAVINGAELIRNFSVEQISFDNGVFEISNGENRVLSKYVINCAGIYADKIAGLIGDNSITIAARKGEYMLIDKKMSYLANTVIFQCPSEMGKGVLVTRTVDGNLLVGPSSIEVDSETRDDLATNADVLADILKSAQRSVPEVNTRDVITSFAGIRAHDISDDFIIAPSAENSAFINVAGIESPGLSAAPAIGVYAAELLLRACGGAEPNSSFNPCRKAPVRFRELSSAEREKLIEKNRSYGKIVCRCETVTEGEILDAIHSTIPATDVDAVKRRTRAGMGRCQSGFCGSKVVELLSRELGIKAEDITKFGGNSTILVGKTK